MILIEKQKQFARLVARLIQFIDQSGIEVTLGETWRPPETATLYAKQGKGSATSLHCSRLAIDLNLFRDGKQCLRGEDFRPVGEWWESQSTADFECAWGGRWGDYDHFSISHQGMR